MKNANAATVQKTPEVADVFVKYGESYIASHSLTPKQLSVVNAITRCRTADCGSHIDVCDHCGHALVLFNSCRDRHCPKCQGINQRIWAQARMRDLLPVPYHHAVFTLPHGLFPLNLYNQRLIYELLFSSSASTLKKFGEDEHWLGAKLGFISVLHTWGQTLWSHVHCHCIIPAGGITEDGQWRHARYGKKFLFPVQALSEVFKATFLKGLKAAYNQGKLKIPDSMKELRLGYRFNDWIRKLSSRDWVVYSKPPFAGPEKVVGYLARYTHRVAISNSRIVSVDNGRVRFSYKDRKDDNRQKEMTLCSDEFIQRFLWHVLPSGFHKIRHYGFLSCGTCKKNVKRIRDILSVDEAVEVTECDPCTPCPLCGNGQMVTVVINIPAKDLPVDFPMVPKGLLSTRQGRAYLN